MSAAGRALSVQASRHFLSWLAESALSLAFTTYQTDRLFLVGRKSDGTLSILERRFDRPMGLYATPQRLYMSTRWQLWELANALPAGQEHEDFDRLYVPRRAHTTGDLDVHDVVVDRDGRVTMVNTAYSCLARLSDRYSFEPLWQPPFISRLAPEDRCHLNGLAMDDGEPAYVTAVSRSDVVSGWRDRRHEGGLVIDVRSNEVVADSLSMPHSPRLHEGDLWVLNSGTGELGRVDRARGTFEPITFCPGYVRGLAFHRGYAIVGLSKPRGERAFSGLALDGRLVEKDAEPRCGLWVVDLESGVVVHWLELQGVVTELYDVQAIPDARRPGALGFKSDEIQRLVTIDVEPRPVFQALATRKPKPGATGATSAPAHATQSTPEAEAAYRRGNELLKQGDLAGATAAYQQAVARDPHHVKAQINLAGIWTRTGRADEALRAYERVLALEPRSDLAHRNLAVLLQTRGELARAVQHLELALEIQPQDPTLWNQLGVSLYEIGEVARARRAFERAIEAAPEYADSYNNLGSVLKIEEQLDEALELHEKATRLDPNSFSAWENIGKIHEDRGDVVRANESYRSALTIRGDSVLALHRALLCPPVFSSRQALDDYRDRAESVIAGLDGTRLGLEPDRVQASRAEPPFDWAYHGRDNLELKRKYAELFRDAFHGSGSPRRSPSPGGPWRIGFVVTPGHEGVFARCLGGLLSRLDDERFEVVVLVPPTRAAPVRSAIANPRIRFLAMPFRFDHAVRRIRATGFDALYYWEVGTDSTNYFLPFLRLAPVQCTGWGWPETSGAPELDYHLTSAALAPAGVEERFSERLVRLPHLPAYFPRPPVPLAPKGPADFGLPVDAHVYLCAQTLRKIHPAFDDLIGAVLRRDRQGVAVFVDERHPTPGELLRHRWRKTLADVEQRIVLLPRLSPEDYFHLVAGAHVCLDPLYFGGANTVYDALGAGVPVVTLPTALPRGRYAAALLHLAQADECIAHTNDDYVERAVRIAGDPAVRTDLAAKIRESGSRVFETPAAVEQLRTFFADALSAG